MINDSGNTDIHLVLPDVLVYHATCTTWLHVELPAHACTNLPPPIGSWRVLGPKDHKVRMGLDQRLCLSDEQLTVVIQYLPYQEESQDSRGSQSASPWQEQTLCLEVAGARGCVTVFTVARCQTLRLMDRWIHVILCVCQRKSILNPADYCTPYRSTVVSYCS